MKTLSLALLLMGCRDNADPLVTPNGQANEGQQGGGVLGKATPVNEYLLLPVDAFINPGDCLAEPLHVIGTSHVRWHFVYDNNGELKLFTDLSQFPDFTATSAGVTYKFIYHNHTVQADGRVFRVVDELLVIAEKGGMQLTGKVMYHVTTTPSGEVTAQFDELNIKCK